MAFIRTTGLIGLALALLATPAAAQTSHSHDGVAHSHDPAASETEGSTVAQPVPEFVYEEAPDDRTMGDPDAPHTMILYASNVCPACGLWFAEEYQAVKTELVETGRLRLVFRPIPSDPVQLSLMGFIMAECAPEDDYMAVIEDQFARQPSILTKVRSRSGDLREDYDAIAAVAGMTDPETVAACLQDQSHIAPLELASARASAAEIEGIPSFIFDGQLMQGDHGVEAIKGWMEGRSSIRD